LSRGHALGPSTRVVGSKAAQLHHGSTHTNGRPTAPGHEKARKIKPFVELSGGFSAPSLRLVGHFDVVSAPFSDRTATRNDEQEHLRRPVRERSRRRRCTPCVSTSDDPFSYPSPLPADLRLSLTFSAGKDAYPICGCTFAFLYAKQPDGKGERLVEFLRWVTQEGQEYNTDLYYARLPQSLADRVEKRLKTVKIGD
jgi:hypothetical protein